MDDYGYTIRPLTDGDFPEWLRLRQLLWDQASVAEHEDEMADVIEHPETQQVFVAEDSSHRLVGFLEAGIRSWAEDCISDQIGYIEGWYVEPGHRRHGIGRSLATAAEQWASAVGCYEMASDTEIGNEEGIEAHRGLGYEETSRLVHLRKSLQ